MKLQTTNSKMKSCISIEISMKFVPNVPVENKSALALVMAWPQAARNNYSLMTCMCHQASKTYQPVNSLTYIQHITVTP